MDSAKGYHAVEDKPLPDLSFMTDAQWDVYFAIVEGLVPAIVPQTKLYNPLVQLAIPDDEFYGAVDTIHAGLSNPPPKAKIIEWMSYRTVEDQGFRDELQSSIAGAALRMQLAQFLGMLSTHIGSLLLTGYWTPITQQPLHVRHKILENWRSSRITALRIVLKSMSSLSQKSLGTSSRYLADVAGYRTLPADWEAKKGYTYNFVQVDDGPGTHTMHTDVVIVGSGCGGGVAAKNLAEAGQDVLVLDKGYHFTADQLPMTQTVGPKHLYDNAGLIISKSSAISIAAGSCWGGGGTVNWSVCLKPQDYVRREWVATGLPILGSTEFDESIDRVFEGLGAGHTAVRHNSQNRVVLEGSQKLGWSANPCPQNTGNKEHYCGRCHLGCGSDEKRGPAVAFLPDAADAGAQFMEGFAVERVVFAADGVTATGVEGTWTARSDDGTVHADESTRRQRKVLIKARKVIVSAGTLWSPTLLLKSGLKNPQIGRNLYLHPAAFMVGQFTESEPQWEGGIITAYNSEFQNLDKKGHGVKLETMCMVPYVGLAIHPWRGALDAKLLLPRLPQLHSIISITRDRDTGRITVDPASGKPRIDYDVSPFDAEHSLEGVEAIAKLMYVMGATALYATIPNVRPFVFAVDGDVERQRAHKAGEDPEFTDPKFAAWLKHLRDVGGKAGQEPSYLSAHQMGTCRMSAKPAGGVVDPHGKVWGCENLYVADASVFPSASGVNPMVTTMAMADFISRRLAKEME